MLGVVVLLAATAGVQPRSGPKPCDGVDLLRPNNNQIRGPATLDRGSVTAWLGRMRAMRDACQPAIGFNASVYDEPGLQWVPKAFLSPQMHVFDRFFFDPALGNGTNGSGYTVDRWLGDLNTRYGGIDKALLWPTYTNLGIDDRNQFDLTRSLPGGAVGLRAVVNQLHAAGVRVMWAYNPWDLDTAGSESAGPGGSTDPEAMAELLRDTGADGFNGDCMGPIPATFYDAATRLYKPIAMEGEGGLGGLSTLNWQTLGWCEGCVADEPGSIDGLDIPDVDRPKWITAGRTISHWSDRYAGSPESRDQTGGLYSPLWSTNMSEGVSKISEIQTVWFNGVGYETFENVWGTWNGIVERDGEAFRRIGLLLRYFGNRDFLTSSEWVPHTVDVLRMSEGIFGSAWPSPDGQEIVYTLVNRRMTALDGKQLSVPPGAAAAGMRHFDCYRGRELNPDPATNTLSFEIEGGGFGCVLATTNATTLPRQLPLAPLQLSKHTLRGPDKLHPENLTALLTTMAALTTRNLSSFSGEWHYAMQTMVAEGTTKVRPLHNASADEVYVPGGPFHFRASGVEVESAAGSGCDVQWPWEDHPGRTHAKDVRVGALYVDKSPVTNAQYHAYLQATGYAPKDRARWLERNFDDGGAPKAGWENRPVTYVSLDDARQYCSHHGKRLPHAFEWQYFAGGADGRVYPWGDDDELDLRTPQANHDFTDPGPEPVGAHPSGASPFGVQDLVRSVWQYTTEFRGPHTANVILRGGSSYSPWRGARNQSAHRNKGSRWYFRQTYRLDTYNTYHLMSGSYERSGTISFRCVADAIDDCGTGGRLCVTQTSSRAALLGEEHGAVDTVSVSSLLGNTIAGPSGALLYPGVGNGFEIRAPASAHDHDAQSELRLRVGSRSGAQGELLASVLGGDNESSVTAQLRVHSPAATLSFTYRGGSLSVRYRNLDSTVCQSDRLCLLSAAPTCPPRVAMAACVTNISLADAIDWAHWGSTNITVEGSNDAPAMWADVTQQKRGGPNILTPSLLMPGCSTSTCHLDQSDLTTWGAKGWPSDGARFSWSGGAPGAESGPGARAGVTSSTGTFQLHIAPSASARTLRLYTGLFALGNQPDSTGSYVNSATLVATSGSSRLNHTVAHIDGNNNDFVNTQFLIVFTGELTVTWGLDRPCAELGTACGSAGMQAATLEPHSGEVVGGVTLESVRLH